MNANKPNDLTIFNAALEISDPLEREAYLDRACADDLALRQKILSLLKAYERTGDDFDQLGGGGTLKLRPERGEVEQPGTVIGRYKLLQKIGEGGCGVVYMAEQEEPVRRRVALKIIKLGMDTKSVIARFEAERQALALMDHPNIAKVHDAGATETGRPYFVMELVRGVKITDYCDEKNLPTQQRLELFSQVCQAIQHAHQKGIIHRDIKPSNILVTVNDGVAVPKVIDFGIAKATTDQRLTDKTVFTAFEQFLGTPAYMSPEQAEMTSLDIDTRSDIYSLGVLLYELLTGKTPFDARELLQAGLDEMRRTIREKEPDRPSTKVSTLGGEELTTTAKRRGLDAPKLVNTLRGDLDWIVMKCLEKDRARRYETANALAMDIQRHLSNEPVVACPPSNLYRFQKMVRRNKLAFTAVAGIGGALVIGLAVALWQSVQKNRAYNRAAAAERAARTEAATSQQVARFLKAMLEGIGPSKAKGRDTEMLREILDEMNERVGKELAEQPGVEVDLRVVIATAYADLGQYEKAEMVLRRALALSQNLSPRGSHDLGVVLNNLGTTLERTGKFKEAEELLRAAIEMESNQMEKAKGLANLGRVLSLQGKLAEAENSYHEALAMAQRSESKQPGVIADIRLMLAGLILKQGKVVEAESAFREVLALEKQLKGSEDITVAVALNGLGMALHRNGKLEEAEATLRQAVAIHKKLHGSEHPETASALDNLAGVLGDEDKFDEAEALLREALRIRKKFLGDEHAITASSLNNLAGVLTQEEKFAEAEQLLRQALVIQTASFGREHPENGVTLASLGYVLGRLGHLGEAEVTIQEGLEILRKMLGNDHPLVAHSLIKWAELLENVGKYAEAEPLLREALAIRQQKLGAEHPVVGHSLFDLGLLLNRRGNLPEAEAALREALAISIKSPGNDYANSTNILAELNKVLTAQGKPPKATLGNNAAQAAPADKK